jgi:membrane protease YdiL (CAAX protease family)
VVFKTFTIPEVLLWAATPIVVAVMALLFSALPELIGKRRGYLAGFVVYWVGFGVVFPLAVTGPDKLLPALRFAPLPGGLVGVGLAAALLLPPLLAGLTVFRRSLSEATAAVLLVSAGLALANGVAEELLWRAAYVRSFPDSPILGLLLPAIGFAVWHLAPQIVLPTRMRGGALGFVAASFVLGLLWGAVAYATGSIVLTIASHVLTDFLGLGGFAYCASKSGAPPLLEA